jgi:hypothetical protein
MKVIGEIEFQYLWNYSISILENIHYKDEKIRDIDFQLMLRGHDQFRKPILYYYILTKTN